MTEKWKQSTILLIFFVNQKKNKISINNYIVEKKFLHEIKLNSYENLPFVLKVKQWFWMLVLSDKCFWKFQNQNLIIVKYL
jgi:hypothetical protein